MTATKPGLEALRQPFPPAVIGKLPKQGIPGGLDYVGHAAVTDRLLTVDPQWTWEPLAFDEAGLPLYDRSGGLWIRLTVLGMTRLGYGDGPDPKQRIGDAVRNAAMRFGVALDLWTKGELESQDPNGGGGDQVRHRPADREAPQRAERGPVPTAQDPWADAPVQRPPVVPDPAWKADITAQVAGCDDVKVLRGIRAEVVRMAKDQHVTEHDAGELLSLIDEAGADLKAKHESEQAKAAVK